MNKFLLEKYLKDRCSESEKLQVQEWLAHPDNREIAEDFILSIWKNEPGKRSLAKVNYDNLWARILLKAKIHFASNSNFRRNKVTSKKYMLAIASGLVLAIVFTGFFLFFVNSKINVSTGFAESKTIELPDGTIINLNNNSQLKYRENFGENGIREIWLQGEAFFKVAHLDNNSRFVVNTDNLEVEVLGTSFNLIDRKEKTEVVLNSGKVKLNEKRKERSLYMSPGELVAIENDKLIKKKVDAALHTSWRHNLLNFQHTSISEIGKMINYNFGKQVIIADREVAELKFTGSNPANDLQLLLETLEITFNLKINQRGGKIYIRKNY
jgi:transmembrane sensor